MPIIKKSNGWYWGGKGPFLTKSKALQVAKAAHASGFKEDDDLEEKRQKGLIVALDYHNTYSADPKFWDTFIYMCKMRKWDVYCITILVSNRIKTYWIALVRYCPMTISFLLKEKQKSLL